VLAYLAAVVAVLILAGVMSSCAIAAADVTPFGFAAWRANAD